MAKQLWQQGAALDSLIHAFTVGNDAQTDLALLPWDIYGTAAHVRTLERAGLLSPEDAQALVAELQVLLRQAQRGALGISPEQEDCHTAIEQALTAALGEPGRNVHLGRSRNDQVLTALRLYMRAQALQLGALCGQLAAAFADFGRQQAQVALPGYTHLRRAMPSSAGLWALSFAEALREELEALEAVLRRLDSCPLGSGAGFGVPLPLDRAYSARLLAFTRVQRNPADCANSRGRLELALASWISGLGNALEKFYWDLALYSTEEFGFVSLPAEFTTGSSIMPQKRNPDVIELCRARCAQLRAWRTEIEQLAGGLPSNYHRDFQLQKEPLMRCVAGLRGLLEITLRLLPGLRINAERCAAACTPELYSAAEAYRRVQSGELAFRDAYAQVGQEITASGARVEWAEKYAGSPALQQAEDAALRAELAALQSALQSEQERVEGCLSALLTPAALPEGG